MQESPPTPPNPQPITATTTSNTTLWFWLTTLSFGGLWALLPSLMHSGYKPDVIELQLIGKEWVLATLKHPMLPAWILEVLNILTGKAFAAPFIAASLCTVVTLFSVWSLARKVLSERLALTAVIVMLPFWPLTVESTKYNQNSTLMACWTLTMLMFFNAFQTNKRRFWIAAGITLGIGLHAKYTMILLAVALLFYSLWNPRFRRYWKETGPWFTVGISFLIFLPHLIWFLQSNRETVMHAIGHQNTSFLDILLEPLTFLIAQFGLLCFSPLIPLIPHLGCCWKVRQPQSENEKEAIGFLLFSLIFPLAVMLFTSLFRVKLTTDYGYTLWFFLGVYLLLRFQPQDNVLAFRRTCYTTSFIVFVMVVVFILQATVSPYLMNSPRRFHFPMHALGAECDRIWYSRYSSPCPYVSGDWFEASNAAYAMKDRPSVHFYYYDIADLNNKPSGTWSTDAMVNQKGGLILWNISSAQEQEVKAPDWINHRFPRAEVLPEMIELPYQTGALLPPLRLGAAIIPPG